MKFEQLSYHTQCHLPSLPYFFIVLLCLALLGLLTDIVAPYVVPERAGEHQKKGTGTRPRTEAGANTDRKKGCPSVAVTPGGERIEGPRERGKEHVRKESRERAVDSCEGRNRCTTLALATKCT